MPSIAAAAPAAAGGGGRGGGGKDDYSQKQQQQQQKQWIKDSSSGIANACSSSSKSGWSTDERALGLQQRTDVIATVSSLAQNLTTGEGERVFFPAQLLLPLELSPKMFSSPLSPSSSFRNNSSSRMWKNSEEGSAEENEEDVTEGRGGVSRTNAMELLAMLALEEQQRKGNSPPSLLSTASPAASASGASASDSAATQAGRVSVSEDAAMLHVAMSLSFPLRKTATSPETETPSATPTTAAAVNNNNTRTHAPDAMQQSNSAVRAIRRPHRSGEIAGADNTPTPLSRTAGTHCSPPAASKDANETLHSSRFHNISSDSNNSNTTSTRMTVTNAVRLAEATRRTAAEKDGLTETGNDGASRAYVSRAKASTPLDVVAIAADTNREDTSRTGATERDCAPRTRTIGGSAEESAASGACVATCPTPTCTFLPVGIAASTPGIAINALEAETETDEGPTTRGGTMSEEFTRHTSSTLVAGRLNMRGKSNSSIDASVHAAAATSTATTVERGETAELADRSIVRTEEDEKAGKEDTCPPCRHTKVTPATGAAAEARTAVVLGNGGIRQTSASLATPIVSSGSTGTSFTDKVLASTSSRLSTGHSTTSAGIVAAMEREVTEERALQLPNMTEKEISYKGAAKTLLEPEIPQMQREKPAASRRGSSAATSSSVSVSDAVLRTCIGAGDTCAVSSAVAALARGAGAAAALRVPSATALPCLLPESDTGGASYDDWKSLQLAAARASSSSPNTMESRSDAVNSNRHENRSDGVGSSKSASSYMSRRSSAEISCIGTGSCRASTTSREAGTTASSCSVSTVECDADTSRSIILSHLHSGIMELCDKNRSRTNSSTSGFDLSSILSTMVGEKGGRDERNDDFGGQSVQTSSLTSGSNNSELVIPSHLLVDLQLLLLLLFEYVCQLMSPLKRQDNGRFYTFHVQRLASPNAQTALFYYADIMAPLCYPNLFCSMETAPAADGGASAEGATAATCSTQAATLFPTDTREAVSTDNTAVATAAASQQVVKKHTEKALLLQPRSAGDHNSEAAGPTTAQQQQQEEEGQQQHTALNKGLSTKEQLPNFSSEVTSLVQTDGGTVAEPASTAAGSACGGLGGEKERGLHAEELIASPPDAAGAFVPTGRAPVNATADTEKALPEGELNIEGPMNDRTEITSNSTEKKTSAAACVRGQERSADATERAVAESGDGASFSPRFAACASAPAAPAVGDNEKTSDAAEGCSATTGTSRGSGISESRTMSLLLLAETLRGAANRGGREAAAAGAPGRRRGFSASNKAAAAETAAAALEALEQCAQGRGGQDKSAGWSLLVLLLLQGLPTNASIFLAVSKCPANQFLRVVGALERAYSLYDLISTSTTSSRGGNNSNNEISASTTTNCNSTTTDSITRTCFSGNSSCCFTDENPRSAWDDIAVSAIDATVNSKEQDLAAAAAAAYERDAFTIATTVHAPRGNAAIPSPPPAATALPVDTVIGADEPPATAATAPGGRPSCVSPSASLQDDTNDCSDGSKAEQLLRGLTQEVPRAVALPDKKETTGSASTPHAPQVGGGSTVSAFLTAAVQRIYDLQQQASISAPPSHKQQQEQQRESSNTASFALSISRSCTSPTLQLHSSPPQEQKEDEELAAISTTADWRSPEDATHTCNDTAVTACHSTTQATASIGASAAAEVVGLQTEILERRSSRNAEDALAGARSEQREGGSDCSVVDMPTSAVSAGGPAESTGSRCSRRSSTGSRRLNSSNSKETNQKDIMSLPDGFLTTAEAASGYTRGRDLLQQEHSQDLFLAKDTTSSNSSSSDGSPSAAKIESTNKSSSDCMKQGSGVADSNRSSSSTEEETDTYFTHRIGNRLVSLEEGSIIATKRFLHNAGSTVSPDDVDLPTAASNANLRAAAARAAVLLPSDDVDVSTLPDCVANPAVVQTSPAAAAAGGCAPRAASAAATAASVETVAAAESREEELLGLLHEEETLATLLDRPLLLRQAQAALLCCGADPVSTADDASGCKQKCGELLLPPSAASISNINTSCRPLSAAALTLPSWRLLFGTDRVDAKGYGSSNNFNGNSNCSSSSNYSSSIEEVTNDNDGSHANDTNTLATASPVSSWQTALLSAFSGCLSRTARVSDGVTSMKNSNREAAGGKTTITEQPTTCSSVATAAAAVVSSIEKVPCDDSEETVAAGVGVPPEQTSAKNKTNGRTKRNKEEFNHGKDAVSAAVSSSLEKHVGGAAASQLQTNIAAAHDNEMGASAGAPPVGGRCSGGGPRRANARKTRRGGGSGNDARSLQQQQQMTTAVHHPHAMNSKKLDSTSNKILGGSSRSSSTQYGSPVRGESIEAADTSGSQNSEKHKNSNVRQCSGGRGAESGGTTTTSAAAGTQPQQQQQQQKVGADGKAGACVEEGGGNGETPSSEKEFYLSASVNKRRHPSVQAEILRHCCSDMLAQRGTRLLDEVLQKLQAAAARGNDSQQRQQHRQGSEESKSAGTAAACGGGGSGDTGARRGRGAGTEGTSGAATGNAVSAAGAAASNAYAAAGGGWGSSKEAGEGQAVASQNAATTSGGGGRTIATGRESECLTETTGVIGLSAAARVTKRPSACTEEGGVRGWNTGSTFTEPVSSSNTVDATGEEEEQQPSPRGRGLRGSDRQQSQQSKRRRLTGNGVWSITPSPCGSQHQQVAANASASHRTPTGPAAHQLPKHASPEQQAQHEQQQGEGCLDADEDQAAMGNWRSLLSRRTPACGEIPFRKGYSSSNTGLHLSVAAGGEGSHAGVAAAASTELAEGKKESHNTSKGGKTVGAVRDSNGGGGGAAATAAALACTSAVGGYGRGGGERGSYDGAAVRGGGGLSSSRRSTSSSSGTASNDTKKQPGTASAAGAPAHGPHRQLHDRLGGSICRGGTAGGVGGGGVRDEAGSGRGTRPKRSSAAATLPPPSDEPHTLPLLLVDCSSKAASMRDDDVSAAGTKGDFPFSTRKEPNSRCTQSRAAATAEPMRTEKWFGAATAAGTGDAAGGAGTSGNNPTVSSARVSGSAGIGGVSVPADAAAAAVGGDGGRGTRSAAAAAKSGLTGSNISDGNNSSRNVSAAAAVPAATVQQALGAAAAAGQHDETMRGVFFNKSLNRWVCTWSRSGKEYQRSWSAGKYGYEAARQLARQCRLEKLLSGEAHTLQKGMAAVFKGAAVNAAAATGTAGATFTHPLPSCPSRSNGSGSNSSRSTSGSYGGGTSDVAATAATAAAATGGGIQKGVNSDTAAAAAAGVPPCTNAAVYQQQEYYQQQQDQLSLAIAAAAGAAARLSGEGTLHMRGGVSAVSSPSDLFGESSGSSNFFATLHNNSGYSGSSINSEGPYENVCNNRSSPLLPDALVWDANNSKDPLSSYGMQISSNRSEETTNGSSESSSRREEGDDVSSSGANRKDAECFSSAGSDVLDRCCRLLLEQELAAAAGDVEMLCMEAAMAGNPSPHPAIAAAAAEILTSTNTNSSGLNTHNSGKSQRPTRSLNAQNVPLPAAASAAQIGPAAASAASFNQMVMLMNACIENDLTFPAALHQHIDAPFLSSQLSDKLPKYSPSTTTMLAPPPSLMSAATAKSLPFTLAAAGASNAPPQ